MAKQCAICGTEKMNLFQAQKLNDGNAICNKTCKKLGLKYFNYQFASLEKTLAHHKQVEQGKKLWEHFFVPRLASKKLKIFKNIFIAEDIGLMAVREKRSLFFFWNKSEHYCVYRIADLSAYRLEKDSKTTVSSKGKTSSSSTFFVGFLFEEQVQALSIFRIQLSKSKCRSLIKYIDSLFGIVTKEKGLFGDLKDSWSYMMSFKEEGKSMTSVNMEEVQIEMMKKSGNYREGDKTKWAEIADAALKEIGN
ncbi:MAG: hypothetical protein FWD56_03900 [Bacteroidales bacterium]|nr:hypothetical protein [Bacteroidales bacterium]